MISAYNSNKVRISFCQTALTLLACLPLVATGNTYDPYNASSSTGDSPANYRSIVPTGADQNKRSDVKPASSELEDLEIL